MLPFLAHLAGAGSLLSAVAEVGWHELPKLRVTFGESVNIVVHGNRRGGMSELSINEKL